MSKTASAPDVPAAEGQADTVSESSAEGVERRLTLRAYHLWEEAAGERAMPQPAAITSSGLAALRDNAFVIVFADGDYLDARFLEVGAAIAAEAGPVAPDTAIREVPQNSLLSRLADYYLQAIAHKAPVGFEAEFERPDGEMVLYRGILLPFAEEADVVERLLGVLSWKVVPADAAAPSPPAEDKSSRTTSPAAAGTAPAADSPLADDVGLQGALAACRTAAERLKTQEARSHEALYAALAKAYAFFLLSELQPAPYAALLRQAEIRAQARAPLTPVLKLIFGRDYAKARLTEYATALAHVRREKVRAEDVRAFLSGFEGGLKGLVAAERAARRAERGTRRPDRLAAARRRLDAAPRLAIDRQGIAAPGAEPYVLLLARRTDAGHVEPVAVVETKEATLAATLHRTATRLDRDARTDRPQKRPKKERV